MKPLKIRIPGQKLENNPADNTGELTIEKTYVIGAATRGEAVAPQTEVLDATKLVEFTYDDGTVWLADASTVDEVFPGASAQLRGLDDDALNIPAEVHLGEPDRSGFAGKVALKIVKIFAKKAVVSLVGDLAAKLEAKQLEEKRGLFRLTGDFKLLPPELEPDGKYLLFLHGTASSTAGSFAELNGSPTWQFITQTHGRNVLAFQHETLTKSPLDNVLDLVRQLPARATLTLVSHSRGGLVGDVLNRFCPDGDGPRGFSAQEKNYLRRHDRDNDLARIDDIEKALREKSIRIEKFIRVACTASGTTLASRRLDVYFNVLFNVVGVALAQATNPVYVAFKDLVAALIDSKDDASVLPGLEVQNPRSPFNQVLNNPTPEALIATPLVVIAGDALFSLRWQGIKVALSNLFFWDDNDFVVDTRSMYNGARRAEGKAQFFFDEGAEVSHFNYFRNPRTQNALRLALQSSGDALIPGFTKLENRAFTEVAVRNIDLSLPGGRVFRNQVSGKKPIVVLLPGIMGSTLTVRERLVWINFFRFATGGLTSLLHSPDSNATIRADALVGSSYRKLTEFLEREYDVVTFPFDWRISMADNAAALNRKVEELLPLGQPIKLIGHSMGGVLIRDFIVNHDGTWQILKASRDFRVLFLGAPLGGAFRIPYVLFGLDSLINTLDFVDIVHSKEELLEVFSQFPGILSLLPLTTDTANDFARPATWQTLRDAFGEANWPLPADALLEQFGAYRDRVLEALPTLAYEQAVYIAGQGRRNQQTISGYRIEEDGTLTFLATKEGDESVTWDSGIPQALLARDAVYFSDVTHGELANEPRLFGAIAEVLKTGTTTQLRRTRPTVRSLDREFPARAVFNFDLSPEGVVKTLLGLGSDGRHKASEAPLQVSVSNGDLKYAMHPVLVGHFDRDGIVSAEKAMDFHLRGELLRRLRLGLYPGPIGTSEIVASGATRGFLGAIVVGLGRQGELTEHLLTRTVKQGAASYLAALNSRPKEAPPRNQNTPNVGISALLVGSGYGGLRIEAAIRAMIQGVQNANAEIRQLYDSPTLIEAIEFVELFKDRALACMKALIAIERDERRSLIIFRSSNTIKKLPGWRERLPVDDTTEWWTRINVRRYTDDELGSQAQRRALRFAISTDAAQVQERSLQTTIPTLMDLLEEASKKDDWSPELAKVLFELLIPNDFKDQIKRQSNINWILDKHTAELPWELLQDDTTATALPLCISAGMIRQLATGDFRTNSTLVAEATAIVIADPDLANPALQLPAARREGEKVAEMFRVGDFTVNHLSHTSAAEILKYLFSKHYKIVHLAGHGEFSTDPDQPTGMLIGPHAHLTPAFIEQMSHVPELVFVNCCYLGETNEEAERLNRSRFRLAANLGTQLIEIGVKAVVVAGWAVNDNAAFDFAQRFYECLFEGSTFGEAVRKARKTVFETHGTRNNTWGAYQCYGDPFYRLIDKARKPTLVYDFIIPEEAETELTNLLNRAEQGEADAEIAQHQEAIGSALRKAGLRSPRITELQALIYAALNEYEKAVGKFDELWAEEKAQFSFSATEKYCNTKVKWLVKTADATDPLPAQEAIRAVIDDLKNLLRFGATDERIAILASSYKRLGFISQGDAQKEAYKTAAAYYARAWANPRNTKKFYPLTNWLALETALVLAGARAWGTDADSDVFGYCLPADAGAATALLDAELTELAKKSDEEKDFWDWVAEATLHLGKLLLGDKHASEQIVLDLFTAAFRLVGSPGQRQAEIEQLAFLENALAMGTSKKAKTLASLLSRLRTALVLLA